jgi:hypothetical protein
MEDKKKDIRNETAGFYIPEYELIEVLRETARNTTTSIHKFLHEDGLKPVPIVPDDFTPEDFKFWVNFAHLSVGTPIESITNEKELRKAISKIPGTHLAAFYPRSPHYAKYTLSEEEINTWERVTLAFNRIDSETSLVKELSQIPCWNKSIAESMWGWYCGKFGAGWKEHDYILDRLNAIDREFKGQNQLSATLTPSKTEAGEEPEPTVNTVKAAEWLIEHVDEITKAEVNDWNSYGSAKQYFNHLTLSTTDPKPDALYRNWTNPNRVPEKWKLPLDKAKNEAKDRIGQK